MEIVTFLILEDNFQFTDRITKLIEQRLNKELKIRSKIYRAKSLNEALRLKELVKIDAHIVDIDLVGKGSGLDYITELAKDHDKEAPAMPVVVISSHEESFIKLQALDGFNVIGYIEKSNFTEELALLNLKRMVRMVRLTNVKTITFERPGEIRVYKEDNVWAITRLSKRKKIEVTIYDEATDQIYKEVFSLKKSLAEVPSLFSSPKAMVRCHKQYLVNPRAIIGQRGDRLLLPLGESVPLGGEFADEKYI